MPRRFANGFPACGVDQAIGELLVEAVNPVALEVTLAVQRELQSRLDEADRLRHDQVERAQYEATWRSAATCAWTPTTGWWPTRWKRDWNREAARIERGARGVRAPPRARRAGADRRTARRDPGAGIGLPAPVARSRHARPRAQAHGPACCWRT